MPIFTSYPQVEVLYEFTVAPSPVKLVVVGVKVIVLFNSKYSKFEESSLVI